MIGRGGERGSGISVLMAQQDDDDDDDIYIYIYKGLVLNDPQRLMCHKIQPTNKLTNFFSL